MPSISTVSTVYDAVSSANRPDVQRIYRIHIQQVNIAQSVLPYSLPLEGFSTIGCAKHRCIAGGVGQANDPRIAWHDLRIQCGAASEYVRSQNNQEQERAIHHNCLLR